MKNYYAGGFSELGTATLAGPEEIGGALRYTFNRAIGTKG
jgi:PRTRC genetic system protein C